MNTQHKVKVLSGLADLTPRKDKLSLSKLRNLYATPHTNNGKDSKLAMDKALKDNGHYNSLQSYIYADETLFTPFLGYPYLSLLQQNGFIQAGVEGLADDMTESWIELNRTESTTTSDDNKVSQLQKAIDSFNLRTLFNKCATLSGYFGGCLMFVDNGDEDRKSALDEKSLKGRLKGFIPIEPINISPMQWNSTNALSDDYYKPASWLILGEEVHASRLLYFTSNELNILLKPSYNFFGIPPAQRAIESVMHFIKDRDSASRLLNKFSMTYFKTDMGSVLYDGNPALLKKRVELMATQRDNDSIIVIDKEDEDFGQINTSLGEVTNIVRLSLEQMPIMFRMPITKFLGISPGGLNATGESDENNWNSYVLSQSKKIFKQPLSTVLELLQYHIWGDVDESISFDFKVRSSRDELNKDTSNKTKSDIACAYIANGVISPAEERKRLAEDPSSGYNTIDLDDTPDTAGLEDDEQQYQDMLGAEDSHFDPFEQDDWG